MGAMQSAGSNDEQGREKTVLHVDLDAFFASVEVRDDPSLHGKPVVVGSDPRGGRGRGVVAAASYEARRFGIHSAMPISQAYRRCPNAAFVRPRGSVYAETSARFMTILERYSDLVEPISIDEAFVDVSDSLRLFGSGEKIAHEIKAAVESEERITASIGVAPVKFVAKVASDWEKPDGLVVVTTEGMAEFLGKVGIERLWGAGPRAVERFRRLGVVTIGDVASISRERLEKEFGAKTAAHFRRLAHGVDERTVKRRRGRKSVGKETTFFEDVFDRGVVESTLLNLLEQVTRRLRQKEIAGHTVTVKLRTADFHTVTRQATLPLPADTTEAAWTTVKDLLARADDPTKAVRLVGVSLSGFDEEPQLELFSAAKSVEHRKLAAALDSVTDRFGSSAVQRGRTRGTRPTGQGARADGGNDTET